jgi:N-acyl-D-amino-acid deacylase
VSRRREYIVHDLVLRGGTVHDGLGGPTLSADVAIAGDRIAAVGADLGTTRRVIDVTGLDVAPGFVDVHSHSDLVPFSGPQPFKLLQGVTTEIVGNCGFSHAPLDDASLEEFRSQLGPALGADALRPWTFGDYLVELAAQPPTNHVAALVGHNMLRLVANGMDEALRPGALERMCELAVESFEQGAIGLSTGLIYVPGAYSNTDEIVALATVARRYGVPYTTHMRDEGDHLEAALDEAIEIGRRAGVRVQVSHCKAAGRRNHGKAPALLDRLHRARLAGVDVRGDQYPYDAAGTAVSALLPTEAHVGGTDTLVRRLADVGERNRLRTVAERPDAAAGSGLWSSVEPADVLVVGHVDAGAVGRSLAELAGDGDAWETACGLIARDPAAMMVLRLMAEDDIRQIMADPLIGVGSDSGDPAGIGHPRTWGCFPRFFGRYVRELGVVAWEEGVRKATSAAADQFGLVGRGWLGVGAHADITVFDRTTIGHDGIYTDPARRATGIEHVVLGGTVVVESGDYTGGRVGRVLRPYI